MGSVYPSDSHKVAATQYPGCFTDEEVRHHLGHPSRSGPAVDDNVRDVEHGHGRTATPENHFLPDCLCSTLHSHCNGEAPSEEKPPVINMSLEYLRYAAGRGCWFCSVIYGGIVAAPPWDPQRSEHIPVYPVFQMPRDRQSWDSLDFAITPFGVNELTKEPDLVFYVDKDKATSSPCKLFLVRTHADRTAPQQQLSFAAANLQKCIETHSCLPKTPPSMPTRLLHVQVVDGKYVLKISTDVSPQPYVTLSHCWGTSFPSGVTTIMENLEARMSVGIPWEVLPTTFRDAVAMTERLGFQYLWIDALCILQDSSADWMAESARMHDVYSHGDLMLSADASPDSQTGIFRAASLSKQWRALPLTSPPKADGDGHTLGSLMWEDHGVKAIFGTIHPILRPAIAYRYQQSGTILHRRPLTTRAWCFQEQRLARRAIHMCIDEALWSCSEGVVECQCGRSGPGRHEFESFAWQRSLPDKECSPKEKHSLWMNTIYNYTERDLSYWTDRLPALSGLAHQFLPVCQSNESGLDDEVKRPFREINLGTYLAGIWSSSLPLGLCWYADNMPGRRLSALASQYIAPSWSWASVSGHILDIQCDLAGQDVTGSLRGGHVTLRTKMIPLRLYYGNFEIPGGNGPWYVYFYMEARDPSTGQWAPTIMYRADYAPPEVEGQLHAGADMIWGDKKTRERVHELTPVSEGEYFGLQLAASHVMVVRPVTGGGPGVFERTGSLQRDWDGEVPDLSPWFEGAETQTVRVV
ncbi:heterokaryon incompatibility protein-domain-containing protein [Podospora conica]|nr:heterokaryon incompatibility protein-domain-containing protein [Schizothecium conicum]